MDLAPEIYTELRKTVSLGLEDVSWLQRVIGGGLPEQAYGTVQRIQDHLWWLNELLRNPGGPEVEVSLKHRTMDLET